MATERVVLVSMELVGVEVGHWCNQCMVSSGMRVWYVTRTGLAMTFHDALGCLDRGCDGDRIELSDTATVLDID